MHQTQMAMPPHHTTAIHPTSMHMSAGPPHGATASGHHFLSSPALASPVGSVGNNNSSNAPLTANAPCSTLFVANLGQFVSEHELKEVFSREADMESRHDVLNKKTEQELHHQLLIATPNRPVPTSSNSSTTTLASIPTALFSGAAGSGGALYSYLLPTASHIAA